jgi:hypothetical protein
MQSTFQVKTNGTSHQVACHRCNKTIYEQNKLGALNGHSYHKPCLKCFVCDKALTLTSYRTSQASINDKEVYCATHAPKNIPTSQLPPSQWHNIKAVLSFNNLKENQQKTSQTGFPNPNKKNEDRHREGSSLLSTRDSFQVQNKITDGKVAALTKQWNSGENLLADRKPRTNKLRTSSVNQDYSSAVQGSESGPERSKQKIHHSHLNIANERQQSTTTSRRPSCTTSTSNLYDCTNHTIDANLNCTVKQTKLISDNFINYNNYIEHIKRNSLADTRNQLLPNEADNKPVDNQSEIRRSSSPDGLDNDAPAPPLVFKKKNIQIKLNVDSMFNEELEFYENMAKATPCNDDESSYGPIEIKRTIVSYDMLNADTRPISVVVSEEPMVNDEHRASSSTRDSFDLYSDDCDNKRYHSSNEIDLYRVTPDITVDELLYENYTNKNRSKSEGLLKFGSFGLLTEGNLIQILKNSIEKSTNTYFMDYGRISISYNYQNGRFTLKIHNAQDLHQIDQKVPLDTYVKVQMLPDPQQTTCSITHIVHNSCNPIWEKSFVFDNIVLTELNARYIYMTVKDNKIASELLSMGVRDEALKMISLGEALVSLADIQEGFWYESSVPLREASEIQNSILSKDL